MHVLCSYAVVSRAVVLVADSQHLPDDLDGTLSLGLVPLLLPICFRLRQLLVVGPALVNAVDFSAAACKHRLVYASACLLALLSRFTV